METINIWADWLWGIFNIIPPGLYWTLPLQLKLPKITVLIIGNTELKSAWIFTHWFCSALWSMSALCSMTAHQRLRTGTLSPTVFSSKAQLSRLPGYMKGCQALYHCGHSVCQCYRSLLKVRFSEPETIQVWSDQCGNKTSFGYKHSCWMILLVLSRSVLPFCYPALIRNWLKPPSLVNHILVLWQLAT